MEPTVVKIPEAALFTRWVEYAATVMRLVKSFFIV